MPDDGSGTKEIYRVQDFDLVPIDSKTYGIFFGGDSYVIKYTYNIGSKVGYIIYFWQASDLKVLIMKTYTSNQIDLFNF